MAGTGFDWDAAWTFVQDDDPDDWDASALADTATEVGGSSVSLDGKAACEVGITLYEDNTGAIDGVVTVYVLGSGGGIADEETTIGSPWAFTITPVQDDTVYKRFSIDPSMYGSFNIAIENQSGQTLAVSVKYRTATVPVAS